MSSPDEMFSQFRIRKKDLLRMPPPPSHPNDEVACSAFRVVLNIARWGRDDQLQILAKDTKFLQYLGKTMTCKSKEFLYKEVCQIISEIAAAQDGTFIQALEEAGLIDNLCSLLEVAKFDVKMEAACALFNCIKHVNKFEQIQDYDTGILQYNFFTLQLCRISVM
ncbi:hypothetical protein POM88_042786 [Heracleum sosnowskyi]|uniref:Uncharacterized protein n=1 Tax=Heracleum sosnowskyi TaxID=360622 RepID=A0AAD8HJI3_9APIA|nr:hypothetical protein POM88_042786 [Heracleum sosnowskyi]